MLDHVGLDVGDYERSKLLRPFVVDPDGNNVEAVCHEPDIARREDIGGRRRR